MPAARELKSENQRALFNLRIRSKAETYIRNGMPPGLAWPRAYRALTRSFAGGILGAGTGAIIGSALGHPGAGAAIGGALGVGTGMLVGNELQNNEVSQGYTQHAVSRQQRQLQEQRREIERLRAEQTE